MAKTLRVRTRTGWVTKPAADLPENRLLAEEVDDNFLAMEDLVSDHEASVDPHAQYEMKVQNNLTAATYPTATDDSNAGYEPRSLWFDTAANESYRCLDATAGAAVWVKTSLTLDELGSAATQDTGTTSGTVPLLELDSESNPALPAVSGLKLTKLAGELVRYSETTATATATIDRASGGIQTFTMTANSTITVTMADGESLTLHLNGGATYTVTWPTMTWVGGSVPTLTGADVIEFWKVGGTLYGAYVGAV